MYLDNAHLNLKISAISLSKISTTRSKVKCILDLTCVCIYFHKYKSIMFIEKMKCNKDINVVIYLKTEVVYACMYVYLNS